MFPCILGLVALTVSEWSALSCLVAVTFLSLRSTLDLLLLLLLLLLFIYLFIYLFADLRYILSVMWKLTPPFLHWSHPLHES